MNPDTNQLAVQEPSIGLMLSKFIETGLTADTVEAFGKLCALKERSDAKESERAFNVAFVELQKEIPQIKATHPVPNNDGTVRYRYAPLEEIDAQLKPLAIKHGFTYSFSEGESDPSKITKVCTIYHIGGHSRSNSFSCRKSSPPKATDTQADGSTHSYAKRGAFCDGFGLIIGHDDDARMIGKPIGKALAEDLEARVKACGANEEAFLKFAGAVSFDAIPDNRFDAMDALLKRKEAGKSEKKDPKTGEYTW